MHTLSFSPFVQVGFLINNPRICLMLPSKYFLNSLEYFLITRLIVWGCARLRKYVIRGHAYPFLFLHSSSADSRFHLILWYTYYAGRVWGSWDSQWHRQALSLLCRKECCIGCGTLDPSHWSPFGTWACSKVEKIIMKANLLPTWRWQYSLRTQQLCQSRNLDRTSRGSSCWQKVHVPNVTQMQNLLLLGAPSSSSK